MLICILCTAEQSKMRLVPDWKIMFSGRWNLIDCPICNTTGSSSPSSEDFRSLPKSNDEV